MNKPSQQDEERWRKLEMAEAIMRYLAEHPKASDTLDGIAEWWIMRQQVQVEFSALKKVLSELTESGYLEVTGEGDRRQYSLKVNKDSMQS